MKLNRRQFIEGGIASALLSGEVLANKNAAPNVLFIMADDLGYGDVSCFGRPDFKTPVIDQLAAEGLKLTDCYANSSVCSPTRTALLTGQYQYRFAAGLEEPIGRNAAGLPGDAPTIASEFRKAGYKTALVGKWHLGGPPDFGPIKNGYDSFYGFYPGGVDYFEHKLSHGKKKLNFKGADGLWEDDVKPVKADGYLTDIFADKTRDYLHSFAKEKTPFFLSLHFSAPHWPWEGPNDVRRSRDLYDVKDEDGGNAKIYAAMVQSLDANIGRVLKTLASLGMDENTIVVFTSDNGGERFSYNWPFVGQKGELLEGGIRVPGIVRWPRQIKAGSVSAQLISSMDWMPTLLAAADPENSVSQDLDGENLLSVLLGKKSAYARRFFWRYKANEQIAVREGAWKYLKLADKEFLFNLEEDQRERANLRIHHPEKFDALKVAFNAWNKTMLPYTDANFSYDVKKLYSDRY